MELTQAASHLHAFDRLDTYRFLLNMNHKRTNANMGAEQS